MREHIMIGLGHYEIFSFSIFSFSYLNNFIAFLCGINIKAQVPYVTTSSALYLVSEHAAEVCCLIGWASDPVAGHA